jgi:hypothetical protein
VTVVDVQRLDKGTLIATQTASSGEPRVDLPRPPPPDRKRSGARARGEHSVQIIRGVKRLAREERLTVVLTECEASHTPRQEWLEGALSRKPDESSWSSPTWTRPNPDSWRLAGLMRRHRRRRRTDARAPSERVSALDRWLRRHPPPATSSNSDTDASPSLVARHECGAAARTDGYRAALENAEIEVNSAFIRHGDLDVESGHEQRDELLQLQNRPTEVFAESDLQALGLYRADRELDC